MTQRLAFMGVPHMRGIGGPNDMGFLGFSQIHHSWMEFLSSNFISLICVPRQPQRSNDHPSKCSERLFSVCEDDRGKLLGEGHLSVFPVVGIRPQE